MYKRIAKRQTEANTSCVIDLLICRMRLNDRIDDQRIIRYVCMCAYDVRRTMIIAKDYSFYQRLPSLCSLSVYVAAIGQVKQLDSTIFDSGHF